MTTSGTVRRPSSRIPRKDPDRSWRPSWLASMRVRILAVVVALLVLSSIGSVLLLRVVLFDRLDDEVSTDLNQEAQEFRLLSEGLDPRTGRPFGEDLSAIFDVYFSREVPDEGETLLAILDGRLYASRRAEAAAAPGDLQPTIEYWMSLERIERGAIDTPAGEARYVAIPLSGDPYDGLFVVANFPDFERSEIDEAVQVEILIQLGTLVLASLIGLALAGRVLRPLRSLATTAREISETDLTRRIPISGHDEASQIAAAFNAMLARLEEAFTVQRRFLDDTSHELRSPLTVIRGHLELLEFDETPEERAATIELVTDEIDRMNDLVSDLILLARAERPDFLHVERMNLQDFVLAVHRKAEGLAGRDWRVDPPDPTTIVADRQRLTQAVLQLAENAVKFTGEGDTIEIGADVTDGQVRIWVHDSGPGVSPEDAERIFQRFGRGSGSRPSSGSGLGLSIVAAIAEAHGGSARLSAGDEGARFEISLPAGPGSSARR